MPDQFKTALRNTIKQVRSKVSITYRTTASDQICTRIRSLEQFQTAEHIAIYHPVNGEIDLTSLWNENSSAEKSFYFPVLNDNLTLSFLPATKTTAFKKIGLAYPNPMQELI